MSPATLKKVPKQGESSIQLSRDNPQRALVLIDCSNDKENRFPVLKSPTMEKSEEYKSKGSSTIWRNPVTYCASIKTRKKKGTTIHSLIGIPIEDLKKFEQDKLDDILEKAKRAIKRAEEKQATKREKDYKNLVKKVKKAIEEKGTKSTTKTKRGSKTIPLGSVKKTIAGEPELDINF